ncbi:MAG TPA: hypothetical protein VNH18_25385 [Bryobacteraceae bacterium]|nr:hypothetical protein [Bryobacteraceae bacterium]
MRLTLFLVPLALFAAATPKYPIDNADVRVIDVVEQPHEKTKMHEHKVNRVMIYRNAGAQDFEFGGGKKSVLKFSENQVMWSPAGGMHAAAVSTPNPVGVVEIELKKPGAGKKVTSALDPLKVDPKHYKLEFENDQVRVLRVRFGAHEGAPLHEHQLTRIILYLTDSKTRVTAADGTVDETPHKAGDIVQGGPTKHSEINTLDHPVEVIVTELKY